MSYDVLLHFYLNERQVLGWVNCGEKDESSVKKIWICHFLEVYFLLVIRTIYGKWAQKIRNCNQFDEGFPSDDLELLRLSYMLTSSKIVELNGQRWD